MTVSRVFHTPDPSAAVPSPHPALTENQKAIYLRLLSRVSSPDFILPHDIAAYRKHSKVHYKALPYPLLKEENGDEGEKWTKLRDDEKCFLSKDQLERVLRSVKWDEGKSILRLEETIVWRREYMDTIVEWEKTVEPESETGKMYILGYDILSRPCIYMHPYRNTIKSPETRQIQFLVYLLEACIALMPAGCETLCFCIDFGSKKGVKSNPTSISNSLTTLNILQNYYVERLGKAIGINIPWLFNGFWKVVSPFIDPVSKEKVLFNASDLTSFIPPTQLEKECFGGSCEFEYDHGTYYEDLVELVRKRKREQLERWKALGGKIGEEEWKIKGGDPKVFGKGEEVEKQVDELEKEIEKVTIEKKQVSSASGSGNGQSNVENEKGSGLVEEEEKVAVQVAA